MRTFLQRATKMFFLKKVFITFCIISVIFSSINPLSFVYVFRSAQELSSYINKAYASTNAAEKEYVIDIGPVTGSTTANYVYTTFFNPSGSEIGRASCRERV